MKIIWTRSAKTDLENVYTFIKRKSGKVAINIHNSILDEVESLKSFPQMAPIEQALQICRRRIARWL